MQRPQGDRRSADENALEVVYVGNATLGAGVAEELSEGAVTTERRGEAALATLETKEVDCVVAEADLPDASGAEFLCAVGELYPDTAQVLLAESVDSATAGVTFVPTRPSAGLPARAARRVRRAVERRNVERTRNRLADRFETLVEGSPDPILTVDDECDVVFANEATGRVFGYDPGELVGESILRVLEESVHSAFEKTVRKLVDEPGHVERNYVELPGRTADGRKIPLAVSFTETERDGRHYFSAIVRDVSERKRLEDRLEAEKRKIRELHEVAVMLESSDTVEEATRLAVETAEQLLEFDLCAVDTIEGDELVPQAVSKGVPTDGYYTTTPIDAEDNLAARAYRTGESVQTSNLHDEGVEPAETDYRAALTVPIADIGVFQAVSKERAAFDDSDRELAELLVSHLAEALKRIQSESALKSEKRKVKELHEVAVMLEECETAEEVYDLTIETAEELLAFDRCVLDVVEGDEHVPQAVSKGLPSDDYYTTTQIDADDNFAARAYRRDETILTSDVRDEDVDPAVDEYRAALTVPVGDIGVFQAVAKEVGAFGENDRELAELLVSHVTQALERIRSERALEAERDRFAALFENVPEPTIDYGIRDGEPVVHSVNEAFEEVFGYDAGEAVGRALGDLIVAPDQRDEYERNLDQMRERGRLNTEVRRVAADGMRDFLLRTASVSGPESGGYAIYTDITDRKQLERDLTREKQKIEELHHVAVKLEGCDTPEEIYRLTVDAAEEILKFDICGVDIEEDGLLVPKATSSELDQTDYDELRADEGFAGQTYQTGESMVVGDIREAGDVDVRSERYRSLLSVPFGDEGILQAGSQTPDAFDEEDVRLAELLVSHAAEALGRVQNEDELRAERDRFAALFENVPEPTVRYEFRDGHPVIRSVNEAFEVVFGYDADEAVGESIDDLLVPEDMETEAYHLNERVAQGERVDAEVQREAADGIRDFLLRNAEVSSGGGNYVIYTDITERKRNEERHRSMTEDVLDETDVGIFVLDDEFDVAWANSAVGEYFGLDRDAILGADKRELIDADIREAVENPEPFEQTVTATYDDNSYVEEFTCHVTAGEGRDERHLHHRSRPIESGLYAGGRVELYYDVTERVRREEMLDALHGATRDLMAAESQRDICEIAVETARDVLDIPHTTVFRWNDETELLEPYILPDHTVAEIGEAPSFGRGEGLVGTLFEEGESEYFADAWNDPRAHDDGSPGINSFGGFPLGDWGMMTVASEHVGAFDDYEIDLVRVLAANAQVALNRAAREAELADQRSQLAELDRINAVIRDVDQLLVRATTREEIEQEVCDRLAASEHYRFAWTGEAMTGTERPEPTASAGVEEGYLEAAFEAREDAAEGPAAKAIESGEVRVVQNIHEDETFEPWREEALERGYRSGAAIPLCYRDTVYGVLCIYTNRAEGFDEREQAVLEELGETIGHAINAAENKKALVSDGVVEVVLEGEDGDGFFARVPRETGGRFELEGVTMTAEGSFVYFVTAAGMDPDEVLERAESADDVEQARLVNEHDDGNLFEIVYTGPSPLPALADHGGTLRDAEFTEEGGRSVVELPRNVDVRAAVESIRESSGPETKVVAQRERERPAQTVEEFRTALDEDITERQRSALEAAYYAGFFEWPRESNGEEVSESLGVSAPTFHQHLRVGERKLLASLLDE